MSKKLRDNNDILNEFLEDVFLDSKVLFEYVQSAGNKKLYEFVLALDELINESKDKGIKENNFNFIANTTLSGQPFPCGDPKCRIEQIGNLAKNAILYADTVFIQNPLEKYLKYKKYNDKLRFDLITDLFIINHIRPLLKEGIFKIAKSKTHFCTNCYKQFQETYLKSFEWNLKTIEPLIEDYILNNIDFILTRENGKICLEISGSNDLLEHPIVVSFVEYIPKPLDKISVKENERIKLDPQIVKKSKAPYLLIEESMDNLCYQDFFSKYYSAHALTNRDFDIQLLQLVNKNFANNHIDKKSQILSNMNHLLPFLGELSIKNLLKFRKNDGEAFKVYRDKLSKIIKQDSISVEYSKELFWDEINPELNKINLAIKNNKKALWGNIKSNIFLASTYVSASLFTGILPSNIDKIVASIGGFGFASSIGKDVIKMIKKPEVRENEFYFLWKIRNDLKTKI